MMTGEKMTVRIKESTRNITDGLRVEGLEWVGEKPPPPPPFFIAAGGVGERVARGKLYNRLRLPWNTARKANLRILMAA